MFRLSLILAFLMVFNGLHCVDDPVIDEDVLMDLKSNVWIKSEYGVFYNENCIKTSLRYFKDNVFYALTKYDFERQYDVNVLNTFDVIFDTSKKPYKMRAIVKSIILNDEVDVTGKQEFEFGNTTRNFPEQGTDVYYIFSVQARKMLLLEGSYTDFPSVFSLNYNYYLIQSDTAVDDIPVSLAGTTWQKVTFIDEKYDVEETQFVDLGENCIEYKLRSFTDQIMTIYLEHNFEDSPDMDMLFTYEYTITGEFNEDQIPDNPQNPEEEYYSFLQDAQTMECKLLSVYSAGKDVTGKTNVNFGRSTIDFGNAGDILYTTFIWYDDVLLMQENLSINDPGQTPITNPDVNPGENPGSEDTPEPPEPDPNVYPNVMGNAVYTIKDSQ